jgi:heat shock protein HslJ
MLLPSLKTLWRTGSSKLQVRFFGLFPLALLLCACGRALLDVTEKDLQHHRWVLESINGDAFLAESAEDSIPDLDFGEQMHVSGNTGCNQYSGKAVLRNGSFLIESMLSTQRLCGATQNELELKLQTVLNHEAVISLDPYKKLTLQSAGTLIVFRLRDWVQ